MSKIGGFTLACTGLAGWALAAPPPGPPSPSQWPVLSDIASTGPRQFLSHHSGEFGGKKLGYTAALSETIVKGPDQRPAASAFTFAFTADGKANPSRPVLFIYNGGPGGASSTLFLGALGPVHVTPFTDASMADPKTIAVNNPSTVLDTADLVFIDPPDTGFSRRLPGTPPRLFLSIDGDAFAVGQIVLHWLSVNHRLTSPIYLVGESYGTLRNVAVARDLLAMPSKIQLRGLVMISQAILYNGPEQMMQRRSPDLTRAIERLSDVAAIAWYHGKIDNVSQSVGEAIESARHYARTDYAEALLQGNRLDEGAKRRVAEKLSKLTGLSTEYYLQQNLRVRDFRKELLKDDGLALAQFDGRSTEPLAGIPEDKDRDWDAAFAGLTQAMSVYAAKEIGVKGLDPYMSLVHDPYGYEEGWTYVVPPAPTLDIVLTDTMQENPDLRLLVPQGIFDTTSSMGATISMFEQLNISPDRVVTTYYAGGHMVYADADSLKKFTSDLRTFVTGGEPSGDYPVVAPAVRHE